MKDLTKRIFENKTKTDIYRSKVGSFANGGGVEQEVWTPYEFLHTLLPKVYGKPYIVSDSVAFKLYSQLEKDELKLDKDIKSLLAKEKVENIFQLDPTVFEKIDNRRKAIEKKKIFVSNSELQAYIFTNPDLKSTDYIKKMDLSKQEMLDMGLILLDFDESGSMKWVYRYQYLSGDINSKISSMSMYPARYKGHLSEEQYNAQLKSLNDSKNKTARITYDSQNRIFINPTSTFASSEDEFRVKTDDYRFYEKAPRDMSLKMAFIGWLQNSDDVDPTDYKVTDGSTSVITYYVNNIKPSESEERVNINKQQNAQTDGEHLFNKFLNDGLNASCKVRLEAIWNAKYNNLVLPKLYKIPVALTISKRWKNDSDFIPNSTQVQSVQFMRNSGSGLLAYGVGVGKTPASIMNISYAIDNNQSKKPLLIVPNPTLEKWVSEIKGRNVESYVVGYVDDNNNEGTKIFNDKKEANNFNKEVKGKIVVKKVFLKGLLPHIKNIVVLDNLNAKVVRKEIKTYTIDEYKQLQDIEDLKSYLSTIEINYEFDDSSINSKIKSIYDDFEIGNIEQKYETYLRKISKKKVTTIKTKFQLFKESVALFARELVYKLGKVNNFEDNTIFIATYEGLSKLGIESLDASSRDVAIDDDSFFGKLFNEFSQGEEISDITENSESLALEKAMFGSVGSPKIFVKELGIDYAVFDESHTFKKVYTKTKGLPTKDGWVSTKTGRINRDKSKYSFSTGSPSSVAVSAYVLVRYIQYNHDNKNVLHLTATPFTNSPLEIYSMLSLTNYKVLVDAGYKNIEDFYDVFLKISYDIRYTASQQIKKEQLLVGYNNAPQMRELIFFVMDYKDGESANIKRPDKYIMPSFEDNVETILPSNDEQKASFKLIKDYIKGEIDMLDVCDNISEDINVDSLSDEEMITITLQSGSERQKELWSVVSLPLVSDSIRIKLKAVVNKLIEKDKAEGLSEAEASESDKGAVRVLKGLSMLKQVTLSPYLFSCKKASGNEPTYKQYIETSPKLLYTVNSIKSTHDYESLKGLKKSGIVMYMNLGVDPIAMIKQDDGTYIKKKWSNGAFEKIKQYFISELGYNENQISIVKGGMSMANKEKEKNRFLSGDSIVLIGSSTISTGVDLQNNASSLFVCSFDWNPTDNEQVMGRIHRMGNRFGKVRIVFPMIENSADPIIFQLLQEKTMRIREIWDKDGRTSSLDLRDFDAGDFKKKLITDPKDRATYWLEENLKELEDEEIMLLNRQQSLRNADDDLSSLEELREPIRGMLTVIDAFRKDVKRKEAISEQELIVRELTSEFMSEPEKLVAELQKANKGKYDHVKDKDNRYTPINLSKSKDDELFKHVTNWVTNSNSWYDKVLDNDDSYDVIRNINEFVNEQYPQYLTGSWGDSSKIEILRKKASDLDDVYEKNMDRINYLKNDKLEELREKHNFDNESLRADEDFISLDSEYRELAEKTNEIRREVKSFESKVKMMQSGVKVVFDNYKRAGITDKAYTWKTAHTVFGKHKEKLAILGVDSNDLGQAKQFIVDRLLAIREDIEGVRAKEDEKYEEFKIEEQERKSIAPTISERVAEFSDMNEEFLGEDGQIETFKEDKAPISESMNKVVRPEPKAKLEVNKSGITIIEGSEQDLTDEDWEDIQGLINIGVKKGSLVIVDNTNGDTSIEWEVKVGKKGQSESEFLKSKIEAFEMMLDIEDDVRELEFLKEKIEGFELMLELSE